MSFSITDLLYTKSSDKDQWRENNWSDGMCKGDVRGITHLLTTTSCPLGKQPKETEASNMRVIYVKGQFTQITKSNPFFSPS